MSTRKSLVFDVKLAGMGSILGMLVLGLAAAGVADEPMRSVRSLSGQWEISLDGGTSFRPEWVPAPFENNSGLFDGRVSYRKTMPAVPIGLEQRLFLRFEAVATLAQVSLNGRSVGTHLGGWTPFEVELTEIARDSVPSDSWEIRVEVDELVGHNTQGFLPVVIPHFGGIWQDVSLVTTNVNRLVSDSVLASSGGDKGLEVGVAIETSGEPQGIALELALRNAEESAFRVVESSKLAALQSTSVAESRSIARIYHRLLSEKLENWTLERPQRYELRLRLLGPNGKILDELKSAICNRRIATEGKKILLNGEATVVRGVLNWGYAPPSFAPSIDEVWMRNEIRFAQERGFNLMKFCLWVPPRRYLELCDEMGMLAWIEYPTWHPQLDQAHLNDLKIEYDEFFRHDRNHPSVILRSLTCETGPSADINVIRELYNRCKQVIPGAIVEDDSSWISWNRVHDFYDDHPYGNNHTWVETLKGLEKYIADHETKPLVLGEAIAADSFHRPGDYPQVDREAALGTEPKTASSINPHRPWFDQSNLDWQKRIEELSRQQGLDVSLRDLPRLSRHYGFLMRKYQIETYRREIPSGGYVVSVIRDFPKAAMGLIDYQNRPKNSPEDWKFQADRMVVLKTNRDARSFWSETRPNFELQLTNSGPAPSSPGSLRVRLMDAREVITNWEEAIAVPSADIDRPVVLNSVFVALPKVDKPTRYLLSAEWTSDRQLTRNAWPIWVFPKTDSRLHTFHTRDVTLRKLDWGLNWLDNTPHDPIENSIEVAHRFDNELIHFLAAGGRAIVVPDGSSGSFPISQHWFLRGSPIGFATRHSGTSNNWLASQPLMVDGKEQAIDFLTELQHFDLAGPVVPSIDHFLEQARPLVLLWDNHDQVDVNTHAAAFLLRVGKGRALITLLDHSGEDNAVGRWLLQTWLRELQSDQGGSWPDSQARLESELSRQGINLHEREWRFQPDPDEVGGIAWAAPDHDDSDWKSIRADRHWEGQGYKELDHWAWYRLNQVLPEDWKGKCYLNLTGVDDYADIYLNGQKIASCGDRAKQVTAFDQQLSVDITQYVRPGQKFVIAIAVYDWFGAGGLFRPMTLSTQPLAESKPMLK